MAPICFDLDMGIVLIALPEKKERDDGLAYTFQLYYSSQGNQISSLNNLNNYSGMISFDRSSQEFYYTPGNFALSYPELLELIEHIKKQIS